MHLRPTTFPHNQEDMFMPSAGGGGGDSHPGDERSSAVDTDPLGDVFGADPLHGDGDGNNQAAVAAAAISGGRPGPDATHHHHHPSDMHRLHAEHTTAGYREGVVAAKARSVQAGFDEGFGLGAALGLRSGGLVGVLEGLAACFPPATDGSGGGGGADGAAAVVTATTANGDGGEGKERERLSALLGEARMELSIPSVFGAEYWAQDGTWLYAVPGEEEGANAVVFRDVVEAHPLVGKWRAIVEEEMRAWGVDKEVFDQGAGAGSGVQEEEAKMKEGVEIKGKRPPGRSTPQAIADGAQKAITKEALQW